jgi:NADPH:quinone reductase-like Zn-dependent oxidoreductase
MVLSSCSRLSLVFRYEANWPRGSHGRDGICHSDSLTKQGTLPLVQYPRVPGHEVVGVIDAVASGVPDGRPGNASESAGTAETAAIATLAAAVISSPARLLLRSPVSPMTAATPIT